MTLKDAWDASNGENRCRGASLCSFENLAVHEDAIVENCIRCGKRLIYNIVDGKIDQRRQTRNHIRDTVQPFGATHELFLEIYGHTALSSFLTKDEPRFNAKEAARDDLRIMNKLSDRGYNDKDLAKWRNNA
jgi:hypothetical protein